MKQLNRRDIFVPLYICVKNGEEENWKEGPNS